MPILYGTLESAREAKELRLLFSRTRTQGFHLPTHMRRRKSSLPFAFNHRVWTWNRMSRIERTRSLRWQNKLIIVASTIRVHIQQDRHIAPGKITQSVIFTRWASRTTGSNICQQRMRLSRDEIYSCRCLSRSPTSEDVTSKVVCKRNVCI